MTIEYAKALQELFHVYQCHSMWFDSEPLRDEDPAITAAMSTARTVGDDDWLPPFETLQELVRTLGGNTAGLPRGLDAPRRFTSVWERIGCRNSTPNARSLKGRRP